MEYTKEYSDRMMISVNKLSKFVNYKYKKIDMDITTKYNVTDVVWYMYQNKTTSSEVKEIFTETKNLSSANIFYNIGSVKKMQEADLFDTKEDLKASL